jgi:hypothetical protein
VHKYIDEAIVDEQAGAGRRVRRHQDRDARTTSEKRTRIYVSVCFGSWEVRRRKSGGSPLSDRCP